MSERNDEPWLSAIKNDPRTEAQMRDDYMREMAALKQPRLGQGLIRTTETADYYRGYHAGLERAAKYHDGQASDCRAIAAVNSDNDLGPDCETHAIDHEVAADEIRAISEATKPRIPAPVGGVGVEK